jgi:hypothetical protein
MLFTPLITKKSKCSVKNPNKRFQALMLFASEVLISLKFASALKA